MNLRTQNLPLNVLEYDSAGDFLRAALESYRRTSKRLSLRQISKQMGFSTPATLSMIAAGKRPITESTFKKLNQFLNLHGRDRRYFYQLALLTRSKTPHEVHRTRESLLRLRAIATENTLEVSKFKFLSNWTYVVLYVLVGSSDFTEDFEALAKKLGRGITASKVQSILDELIQLGLIERNSSGQLIQKQNALRVNDDIYDSAALMYHVQMVELAVESLKLPVHEREVQGMTIQVSKEKLSEAKRRIRSFRKEMHDFLATDTSGGDVFQLMVNFFPLTKNPRKDDPS